MFVVNVIGGARAWGKYRMSFTNLSSGKSHNFGGEYLEFLP